MPIRPGNRDRYPPDWAAISERVRRGAGNCCERCGVTNGAMIRRGHVRGVTAVRRPANAADDGDGFCAETGNPMPGTGGTAVQWGKPVRIVLTVAHLDHRPENCGSDNLRAWCQRCHNRHGAPMRRAGIVARRRAARAIGDLFGDAGDTPPTDPLRTMVRCPGAAGPGNIPATAAWSPPMIPTPEDWQSFAGITAIVILLGGVVVALRRLGLLPGASPAASRPVSEVAQRLDRHEGRIAGLEQAVSGLASREDMHRLQVAIEQQAGSMHELRALMERDALAVTRLSSAITRIEDHLLGDRP